jgi:hypothetical protein
MAPHFYSRFVFRRHSIVIPAWWLSSGRYCEWIWSTLQQNKFSVKLLSRPIRKWTSSSPNQSFLSIKEASCYSWICLWTAIIHSRIARLRKLLSCRDRSRYFFFQVAPQLYWRSWVDPVSDSPLLRKSWLRESSPDFWISSQELWSLSDHWAMSLLCLGE